MVALLEPSLICSQDLWSSASDRWVLGHISLSADCLCQTTSSRRRPLSKNGFVVFSRPVAGCKPDSALWRKFFMAPRLNFTLVLSAVCPDTQVNPG